MLILDGIDLAVQQPILHAHPWLARASEVLHAVGPGRLAWMEAMLSALDGTPLSEHQKVGAIGLLASHTLDRLRIGEELSSTGRTAAVGATADGAPAPDLGELITMLASADEHPALRRAAAAGRVLLPGRRPRRRGRAGLRDRAHPRRDRAPDRARLLTRPQPTPSTAASGVSVARGRLGA